MADYVITPSAVVPSATATIVTKTAAASITAGDAVCLDTDKKVVLTDASDTTLINMVGIAVNSAEDGQPVSYVSVDDDLAGIPSSNGDPIYLSSAVAGKLTGTFADLGAGDTPVVAGMGVGSAKTSINCQDPLPFKAAEVL